MRGLGAGLLTCCSIFLLALGTGAASAAGAPAVPRFELSRDGVLTLVALPEILSREEVRPHLGSGLTTSFVLDVEVIDARGRSFRGAGRIDVRYELWDEVYLIRLYGAGGARYAPAARSFEELQAAWRGVRLPIASAGSADRTAGPWRVAVALSVVPFSQSEQRDAQKWLNDSIAVRPAPGLPSPGRAAEPATDAGSNRVLDLFLGSSIKRRSLVRYDWTVDFKPEAPR